MSHFLSVEQFLHEYVPAVLDDDAAVFAGAGLSRASGYVDWKTLLRSFAEELGLDLDIETDLVAVAQYHFNREGRVKARLSQKVVDEFTRAATLSEAHKNLAAIPIKTFWTSNYDGLIEHALCAADRSPIVRKPGTSMTSTPRGRTAEVLKLHGDVSDPDRVVITKEDYERYAAANPALLIRLQNDLITKSFLFVGFSFYDPNLELILSQVRQAAGDPPRQHYAIFKRPQRVEYATPKKFKYELNRWQLRMEDLQRYGVKPVVVEEYDDVAEVIRQVRLRSQRRRVFVSGSFADPSPWERARIEGFCQALGRRIVQEGFDLANGFGLGVGSPVIAGALEELYRRGADLLERRLLLRPFPQTPPQSMSGAALWDRYRRDLIAPTGFAVFVSGNKEDESGGIVRADGMRDEFDIAVELQTFVLPIGSTGNVARELWERVHDDFERYFPGKTPRKSFKMLGSPTATDQQLLDALFHLVHWLAVHG